MDDAFLAGMGDGASRAIGFGIQLFGAWIAFFVTAKALEESKRRSRTILTAYVVVVGIALFAAFNDSPACADSDGLYGGCHEYFAEDGAPSRNPGDTFAFMALLFGVPVTLVCLDDISVTARRVKKAIVRDWRKGLDRV